MAELDKGNIILTNESYFARRVALRCIVKRPVKGWQQIIPGMFIFAFLRRQRETRLFSQYYLFPRKLALKAAEELTAGFGTPAGNSSWPEALEPWLTDQKINSESVHREMVRLVELLIDHYRKLLPADGTSYDDLVKNAYAKQEEYEAYLDQLTSVEDRIDEAIIEKFEQSETVRHDLVAKRTEKHYLRASDTEAMFVD
jgi:hypothetical protein